MEYILYNAILALLDCENTTILGLPRMLIDPMYRMWVVRQIRDPLLRSFWLNEYGNYDKRFVNEAIAPIQNKVGQFIVNPVIRNILGQVRSKIDFPFMMNERRIFLANLSKGKLGDASNLLGSMVTAQFQLAAMSRGDIPEDERVPFYLFIDEFQNFTGDTFTSILAESRKFRLALILTHQYTSQLSDEIRNAIFGNAGTIISFRVGNADTGILEREFGESIPAHRFVDLPNHHVLIKPLRNGTASEPFEAKTINHPFERFGARNAIIRRSRERFTTGRSTVEGKITRWMDNSQRQK